MKVKSSSEVLVPVSTYLSPKNKAWVKAQAKKTGMSFYQFLNDTVSYVRNVSK